MGKKYWEEQIKVLGGPDYVAAAPKDVETYGAELASHTGYKYFGAAKDLPGVRELFETEVVPEAPRKTRKQLFKNIQPDYYGWRDEEDGELVLVEQAAEMEAQAKEIARWKAEQANKPPEKKQRVDEERKVPAAKPVAAPPVAATKTNDSQGVDFKAYVDVPTMEDIEKLILEKKKQAVLNRYASAEMQAKGKESSDLVKGGKDEPKESPDTADADA